MARLALAHSLKLADAAGYDAPEAVTPTNVGNTLVVAATAREEPMEGEVGPALGTYAGAVKLALATGLPALAARTALNAARLLARRGEGAAAAARVRLALDQLERAPGGAGLGGSGGEGRGARSALATPWQVSDAATAVAAAEFYRQLGARDRQGGGAPAGAAGSAG